MKKTMLMTVLFFALPLLALCAQDVASASHLRKVYEGSVGKIEGSHATSLTTLNASYLAALKKQRNHAQKYGMLDNVLLIGREVTRFEKDKTISEDNFIKASAAVLKLQRKYIGAVKSFSLKRDQQIVSLSAKYVSHLNLSEKKLTIAGKLDKAIAFKEESERVLATDKLVSAQASVATIKKRKKAVATAVPKKKSAPAVKKKKFSMEKQAKIDILVKKGKKTALARNGDYDDKKQELTLSLQVKNRETSTDFEGLKVELFIFFLGLGSDSGEDLLAVKEEYSCDLPRRKAVVFEAGSFNMEYDDNQAAQYGHKYDSYLVAISDSDGDVIRIRSNNKYLVPRLEEFRKLNAGDTLKM